MVFHPAIQLEIARQVFQDRLASAESRGVVALRLRADRREPQVPDRVRRLSTLLRRAVGSSDLPAGELDRERAFLIRHSRAGDQGALERLARLDSRTLPVGSFLLAEIHGEVVAAASIDSDAEPLGDPFRPTADLRQLLSLQAHYARRHRKSIARAGGAARRSVREAA